MVDVNLSKDFSFPARIRESTNDRHVGSFKAAAPSLASMAFASKADQIRDTAETSNSGITQPV